VALATKKKGTQALVLAPTRELAEQIFREITRLSTGRRVQVRLLKKSNTLEKQVRSSILRRDVMCDELKF
jgi:superfamily II DNA/RNA helicase